MSTAAINHIIGGMDLSNLNEGQIVAIKRLAFYAELGCDTLADDRRAKAAETAAEEPVVRDDWIAASKKMSGRANECHTLYKRLSQLQEQGVAS
tara:strand:- start:31 stop:312 length:282 start_codon:yes stop_codon:yes gene_type:complete